MSFSHQIPVTDRYASLDCGGGALHASDERAVAWSGGRLKDQTAPRGSPLWAV